MQCTGRLCKCMSHPKLLPSNWHCWNRYIYFSLHGKKKSSQINSWIFSSFKNSWRYKRHPLALTTASFTLNSHNFAASLGREKAFELGQGPCLGGFPAPAFGGEQRSGGHFLPLPLVSACGTNMGNAKFKQLQMGEGTSRLVLHMFFSWPGWI